MGSAAPICTGLLCCVWEVLERWSWGEVALQPQIERAAPEDPAAETRGDPCWRPWLSGSPPDG